MVKNEYLIKISDNPQTKSPNFRDVFGSKLVQENILDHSAEIFSENSDPIPLLKAAGSSEHGEIINLEHIGGTAILAGGKNFGEGGAKEAARWESALNELLVKGLVKREGHDGKTSRLTHQGWVLANNV